jgi:hypothetical protein
MMRRYRLKVLKRHLVPMLPVTDTQSGNAAAQAV